jgi:hypothetical protein
VLNVLLLVLLVLLLLLPLLLLLLLLTLRMLLLLLLLLLRMARMLLRRPPKYWDSNTQTLARCWWTKRIASSTMVTWLPKMSTSQVGLLLIRRLNEIRCRSVV